MQTDRKNEIATRAFLLIFLTSILYSCRDIHNKFPAQLYFRLLLFQNQYWVNQRLSRENYHY